MKPLSSEHQALIERSVRDFGVDGILSRLLEKSLWMALQTNRYPRRIERTKLCMELGYLTLAVRQATEALGPEKIELFEKEAIQELEKALRRTVPR